MTISILSLGDAKPRIASGVFIAPGTAIIGDVTIEAGASIWFNCVLRGDVAPIRIGSGTNIQDGTIVHADPGFPTVIDPDVLVGHRAVIHGCTIGEGGFVGMGAVVLTGAAIEADGMLAACALLTGGKTIGTRTLWAGQPARYLRHLREEERTAMRDGVRHYQENAARYRDASSTWQ